MEALALAILIYFAVAAVWDILFPDHVTLKISNPLRAVAALGAQGAMFVLSFIVLGVSTPWIVAAGAGYLCLAFIKAAVDYIA